jgi:hypothetical protein
MKRVCGIFSQILQLIPRDRFEAAVEKHQAEGHARGFSSWGQMVQCCSASWVKPSRCVRSWAGCKPAKGSYGIWDCRTAPARSTLAYANSHGPWQLFETVYSSTVGRLPEAVGGRQSGE